MELYVNDYNSNQLEADIAALKRMVNDYAVINTVNAQWHRRAGETLFLLVFPAGEELLDWGSFEARMRSTRITFGQRAVSISEDVREANKASTVKKGKGKRKRKRGVSVGESNHVGSRSGGEMLKGEFFVGMGGFDSATPDQKRTRNQKKGTSYIKRLQATSEAVVGTSHEWYSSLDADVVPGM